MPNWCNNNLFVEGEKKELNKFKKKAVKDKEPLCLDNFVPMPKELDIDSGCFSGDKKTEMEKIYKENEKKYGYKSWYEWRIENWGTKWDISDVEIMDSGDTFIQYMFDTAWSPPTEWLRKVSEKYPELKFKIVFREDGMGFMGAEYYEGGKLSNSKDIDTGVIMDELTNEGLDNESDIYWERYEDKIADIENSW